MGQDVKEQSDILFFFTQIQIRRRESVVTKASSFLLLQLLSCWESLVLDTEMKLILSIWFGVKMENRKGSECPFFWCEQIQLKVKRNNLMTLRFKCHLKVIFYMLLLINKSPWTKAKVNVSPNNSGVCVCVSQPDLSSFCARIPHIPSCCPNYSLTKCGFIRRWK